MTPCSPADPPALAWFSRAPRSGSARSGCGEKAGMSRKCFSKIELARRPQGQCGPPAVEPRFAGPARPVGRRSPALPRAPHRAAKVRKRQSPASPGRRRVASGRRVASWRRRSVRPCGRARGLAKCRRNPRTDGAASTDPRHARSAGKARFRRRQRRSDTLFSDDSRDRGLADMHICACASLDGVWSGFGGCATSGGIGPQKSCNAYPVPVTPNAKSLIGAMRIMSP